VVSARSLEDEVIRTLEEGSKTSVGIHSNASIENDRKRPENSPTSPELYGKSLDSIYYSTSSSHGIGTETSHKCNGNGDNSTGNSHRPNGNENGIDGQKPNTGDNKSQNSTSGHSQNSSGYNSHNSSDSQKVAEERQGMWYANNNGRRPSFFAYSHKIKKETHDLLHNNKINQEASQTPSDKENVSINTEQEARAFLKEYRMRKIASQPTSALPRDHSHNHDSDSQHGLIVTNGAARLQTAENSRPYPLNINGVMKDSSINSAAPANNAQHDDVNDYGQRVEYWKHAQDFLNQHGRAKDTTTTTTAAAAAEGDDADELADKDVFNSSTLLSVRTLSAPGALPLTTRRSEFIRQVPSTASFRSFR
jgi:hypothetical protein